MNQYETFEGKLPGCSLVDIKTITGIEYLNINIHDTYGPYLRTKDGTVVKFSEIAEIRCSDLS